MKELVYTRGSGSVVPAPEDPRPCETEVIMDSQSCGSAPEGSDGSNIEADKGSGIVGYDTQNSDISSTKLDTGGSERTVVHHGSSSSESSSVKHAATHSKLSADYDTMSVECVTENLGAEHNQSTKYNQESTESMRCEPKSDEDAETSAGLTLSQRDTAQVSTLNSDDSRCALHLEKDQQDRITLLLEMEDAVSDGLVSKVMGEDNLTFGCDLEQQIDQVQVGIGSVANQTNSCSIKLGEQGSDINLGNQIEKDINNDAKNQAVKSGCTDMEKQVDGDNDVRCQSVEGSCTDIEKQLLDISTSDSREETVESSSTDMENVASQVSGMNVIKTEQSSNSNMIVTAGQDTHHTDSGETIEKISDSIEKGESFGEHVEKQEENVSSGDPDAEMNDVLSDEPSEDLHTTKLGKICRICGEMTVKYDGPKKGVPKEEVVKHVKKVWNVDISNESAEVYPLNVCLSCERKIKRIYLKVSKRKKCELFRDKPAEFVEHSGSDCTVCLLKEETPLPILSSESIIKNKGSVGGGAADAQETLTKNNAPPQAQESRRNTTRKRSREELRDAFRTIGIQTEDPGNLDSITGLEEHDYTQEEALRQYLIMPKKIGTRTPYQKQSLCSVNAKYIRQDRLKPLISHIDKFCQVHKEDKIDVMFFLLIQTLRDANDRARENLVTDIWCKKNSIGVSLTDEECLAKRILLKQTKEQYRKEYCYYKDKLDKSVLKPPFIIDRLEKTYFPEHLDYFVTDGKAGPVIYQHEKSTHPSHFNITELPESKIDAGRGGSVVGTRWHYFDAVAKTLEELSCYTENEIQDLDEETCIHVDMMDYFEEKRDMTSLSDKTTDAPGPGGRTAQCKMMTYFFGVQSMQAVVESKVTPLYKANSFTTLFRPLMKAIVGEGSAINPTYAAIEMERTAMADKIFHITLPNGTPLRFMVTFTNSAAEMRKDYRNTIGLSLSSFKKAPVVINRYGSVCLELKRSWLASSPRLVHISQVTNSRTRCSRCGEQGHNVRKCSVPSDGGRDGTHRRKKKQRTVPPSPYPSPPSQTLQPPARTSEMMEMAPPPPPPPLQAPLQQQHQHQQLQQQQQQQEQQQPQQPQPAPCSILPDTPDNLSQEDGADIIRSTEQILWTCPGLSNVPPTEDTQVLIPATAPVSSSSAQYPGVVPQRSQAGSAPVYVWAYTVVQPTHTGGQQAPSEQLSLVPPPQQPAQALTVVQHHSVPHHSTPQSHQQIAGTAGTHQQVSQSDSTQASQQQLPVIHHQQQQQPTPSSQHLPVIHQHQQQQQQQQTPTSQQQIIVTHHQASQPDTSQSSQQQHLHVIHQQARQVVPASQPSQHLHILPQLTRIPAPPQQLPVIHQQSSRHTASHLNQLQQVSQKTSSQINLIPQQMSIVHQQAAAPQPALSAVQQQQRAAHQATLTHQTQLHSTDATQAQQVLHPQTSSIQPVLDTNWQPQ
ncbi:hypothetical protein O3P69_010408 [Scylla paramamosain]|uniref:V(D)J recombination-activating protein 1 n=1 Tax=Scylla paramamosain TaxID=85552 RepID=A0AAW0TUE7_SCYPA